MIQNKNSIGILLCDFDLNPKPIFGNKTQVVFCKIPKNKWQPDRCRSNAVEVSFEYYNLGFPTQTE